MTNKEVFYLAGECLSMNDHPQFRQKMIDMIADDSIDWEKMVAVCSEHLILPTIYLKFKQNNLLEFLPDELSEFLSEIYELNLARNARIIQQLTDISTLLNKHGIIPVFLKGTGNLIDNLYCDRGERMIGDIDFLVEEKDYLPTAKILEEDGYEAIVRVYGELTSMKHYPRLAKPGAEVIVEIHRQLVSDHLSRKFNAGNIQKELKILNHSASCYILSDRDKAIHNFIHSQIGHQADMYGVVSFRDLYDFYLLSKRIDAREIAGFGQFRKEAVTYLVLAGKAFNQSGMFQDKIPFNSKLFILKHGLNMNSKLFYHSFRTIRYLIDRLFDGYLGQFFQFFYSKRMRRSVVLRLTTRQWYLDHLASYGSFFRREH